jgi:hypothetical protein
LTAAPLKGLKVSLSAVENWSNYRGSIPSVLGSSDKTYAWGQTGRDYPNWSAAFMADSSASNNFLVSLRGGYHLQDNNNEQIGVTHSTIGFTYET